MKTPVKGPNMPTVRRPNLDYDSYETPSKAYFKNSLAVTQLINAFSASATPLERFFIEDMRENLDKITDPILKEQVERFIKQEANHSAEHHQANKFLAKRLGVDIAVVQDAVAKNIELISGGGLAQLRTALVLQGEHMLGEFGHLMLDENLVKDIEEPMKTLIKWHCYEEFEHNCIAVDLYYHLYGVNLQSYKVRMKALWLNISKGMSTQAKNPYRLLTAMGEKITFRHRWDLFVFNYISPRFKLKMLRRMLHLLNPWFHPRKIRSVDDCLEKFKHVVKEEWETEKA